MKGLALSVYTQCRRLLIQSLFGRPLTSFGPAAGNSKVLKSDPNGRLTNMRLYMPPFTLAVNRNVQASQLAISDHQDNCGVLLCGYCLSEDQRWLLAVCTDSVGSILETRTINIDIPNRNRRKNVSARKIGLSKLWDFLLGVMSTTTLSWRLVIGRFGRLGHGELKGWAGLLSRKHLQQGCKQLREMCVMCGMAGNNDAPYIVSACLVSLEVHPTIHIMTDSVKVEEKQSSDCPMSTPKDASCTHILVFPTSALAQANQPVNHQEHPIDLSTEDIFQGLDELDAEDIFSSLTDPDGSPKNNSAPGSPSHTAGGGMPMMNGTSKSKSLSDIQDEEHNLLQQPLAMGFYVSTASTGPLPKWFWGQCPEREDVCPTCFKAALHIHCPAAQQNPDEFLQTPHKHNHPLDSSLTCDVLRYVLEMYNALSWLTIDPMTDDRRSCLPAHLVVLMQLYHAVRSFV
ncbi:hypothetical protein NP493_998g00002 [Ridgeia piscesae]|uniref:Mediator of RNA polymerase II transcription subunit 13 n=1 Tax=Ridgeia piscesae TaxID=27915 RepID=A0AAD9KJ06_RIDPI|nr:hypothetical protein NP493_998g00002 [Ridgeia piscesae]